MDNIKENNRLIAEFMGYQHNGKPFAHFAVDYEKQYHTSWDWLMPVVEKIERLNYDVNIHGGCLVIIRDTDPDRSDGDELIDVSEPTKLLSSYRAIVDFIKWYNENK